MSRRDFLKAAGLTGVALAAAPHLSVWGSRSILGGASAAAAVPDDPIRALAAALDYDVERIFRFVADEIRYEPYGGILRGAHGTLASRAGNSADQSLLLGALLEASLLPVRFVSGALGEDQAADLLAWSARDPDAALQDVDVVLRGSAPPAGSATDLSPDARDVLARLPDLVERSVMLAAERTDRAIATITGALSSAGIVLPSEGPSLPELEVTQHAWVQFASGSDWLDLDPSMPDAASGTAHAQPAGDPMDALPDAWRHRIEFILTTETVSGGSLEQVPVIEHSAFADELAGKAVTFSHEKPEGLASLGLALGTAMTGGVAYQPILSVGDLTLLGIEPLVFGTTGGGLAETEASRLQDGETTAEWLELRVVTPEAEQVTRRTIFDRIGDESRRSGGIDLAAIAPVELVAIDADLRDEFVPMRDVHLMDIATGGTSVDRFVADGENLTDAQALMLFPATFHMLRDALVGAVGLPRGARTFLDRPNVVDYTLRLEPGDASPGDERVDLMVDLLARGSAMLPLMGSSPAVPPLLTTGVIAHQAERLAAGDGLADDPYPAMSTRSVGAVFEAAEQQGVASRVLRDAAEADTMPVAPSVAGLLRSGLQAGWVAVVPERPVQVGAQEQFGWWLVDPASGAAIDMFEDGRGAAATEETLLYSRIAFWARKFVCLGLAIKEVKTLAALIKGDYEGFAIGVAVGYPLHKFLGGHCH